MWLSWDSKYQTLDMGYGALLFLHESVCCGYSLEMPSSGASNGIHIVQFCTDIRKLSALNNLDYPELWNTSRH